MTYLYKSRPYIFAFLLFCVISSKHIIIYNEELLVLGTFLAFVIYITRAFGNSIKDSIDESRNSILQELQSLAVHKKNGALHLKTIHEKNYIYKSLSSIEKYIVSYVSQTGKYATSSLNKNARQQIQLRCEQAKSSSQLLFTSYQQTMSNSFLPLIYVSLKKKNFLKISKGLKVRDDISLQTAKKAIMLLKT